MVTTGTLKQVALEPVAEGEGLQLVHEVGGFRSLGDMFQAAVARFGEAAAMRYRDTTRAEWVTLDWLQLADLVHRVSAGMMALGVEHGDRVAILSASRHEWSVIDLANFYCGAVTVPVYQSNLSHEVEYALEHSGSRVVFCEDREQLAKVLEVWGRLPELRHAVLIEGKVKDDDGPLRSWAQLLEQGKRMLAEDAGALEGRCNAVGPGDVATIVYTSGTTGPPKGVVLTHGNVIFEAVALEQTLAVDDRDETLLFLPLAHIFARVGALGALKLGYTIAFAESIERAVDNMAEVRPTFVFSVPRIYEKVYEKVVGQVQRGSRLKKQIFAFAMAVGSAVSRARQAGRRTQFYLHFSYQAAKLLVFNKLKQTFGGKLRFFISGGAPLAREIAEFMHAADILVLEGYGLTENVAAANLNLLTSYRFGTVGPALPGVEQRIAEDGELLMRGPNVFREYYKRPEATAEVLDAEGWFHTGDIGEIDGDGFLKITDRKKDLIVTAGGKNVAPQNIENLVKTDPFISQVMVYGDRRKFLTALVTLNPEELQRYAAHHALETEDWDQLVQHPRIQDKVERVLKAKNRSLASYETIKKFAVVWPDFEVGEELTPSLKVKRKYTSEKYQHLLDALYETQ